jgi:dihydrofolate synthase/folylpolyglutamate synthase
MEALLHRADRSPTEAELAQRLERMRLFLSSLGNPHQRYQTIHITGTSGKGSTTAFIAAILAAAGYRVGSHMTPHVQVPTERFQVNGRYASSDDVADLVDRLWPESPAAPWSLSYRELSVAMAFQYFADQGVDCAAIEVGMGGRYDYTNVIMPLAAAIVSVDYDHVAALGPRLEDIARHKAGIIKAHTPVITAVQNDAALRVITRTAQDQAAPLYRIGREVTYSGVRVRQEGTSFTYASPWSSPLRMELAMLGRHQVINACVAAATVESIHNHLPVSPSALAEGLRSVRLPGRLEVVQRSPTVILDGAHNPEKMRALAHALREIFPSRDHRLIVVVGLLQSKDAQQTLAPLLPHAEIVVCTAPVVQEKPATDPALLAHLAGLAGRQAHVIPNPEAALDYALDRARPHDTICVTGSLYLVGHLRARWIPPEAILAHRSSFPPHT